MKTHPGGMAFKGVRGLQNPPLTPAFESALEAPDLCLLTIITINRNNALGLARTLRSLASMRADPRIEFICVDGASEDGSVVVAKSFYLPEKLISEPDRGIYHAMNKGLCLARGKYVLWLNSGDLLEPDVSSDIVDALSVSSSTVLSFPVNRICSEDPSRSHVWRGSTDALPNDTLPHQGAFFLRRRTLEYGGYSEKYKISGDRDLILRMFFSGEEIVFGERVVANFYSGGVSSSYEMRWENIEINHAIGRYSYLGCCWKKAKFLIRKAFRDASRIVS